MRIKNLTCSNFGLFSVQGNFLVHLWIIFSRTPTFESLDSPVWSPCTCASAVRAGSQICQNGDPSTWFSFSVSGQSHGEANLVSGPDGEQTVLVWPKDVINVFCVDMLHNSDRCCWVFSLRCLKMLQQNFALTVSPKEANSCVEFPKFYAWILCIWDWK